MHVNGYVFHSTKGLSMWIGKRSKTKPTWPGKLDQMVSVFISMFIRKDAGGI